MIAWNGDAAARRDMIERLRTAVENRSFQPNDREPNFRGALTCLVGEENPALFAERSGFPESIVKLLTVVSQSLPRDEAGPAILAWLDATAAGTDLSPLAEQVLLAALSEPWIVGASVDHLDVKAVYDQLVALHRAEIGGTPAARQDWRRVRKQAVALVEASEEDRGELLALETVAWPAATTPEILLDLNRYEIDAKRAAIIATKDLPPEQPGDQQLIGKTFAEQKQTGLEGKDLAAAVDRVLAERHPDFFARHSVVMAVSQEVRLATTQAANDRVLGQLTELSRATPTVVLENAQ